MFLLTALSVLGVIALGPQVVLGNFKFKLSPVNQCEPVNITFSGGDANNHSVPTIITILPLVDGAAPLRIPVPNGASNSTGIQLSFIPLSANTRFIASLDDIEGPLAKVSDVTKVAPPADPNAPAACFAAAPPVNFFQFNDTVSQCEPFTVTFNTDLNVGPPNITAFSPRNGAKRMQPLSGSGNTATYTMTVQRDEEVVLLFDDGLNHLQTTNLMTVLGDSSSDNSCIKKGGGGSANDKSPNPKTNSAGLPKSAIIGIVVGASVLTVFVVLLLLYYLRERRRRKRISDMDFDPTLLNRRWSPDEKTGTNPFAGYLSAAPPPPPSADGYVHDPIYTNEKYAATIMSDARTSIGSWNQFVPADQRSPGTPQRPSSAVPSRLSMNTVDIQDILQMATVHRDRASGAPDTAGSAATTFDIAKPAIARLVSLRRRGSDAPDMPAPADLSRNDSAYTAAVAGVPAGYGPSSYMSFGDSDDGRSVDQGIGGYPVPTFTPVRNPRDTSESWGNIVVR
ncbi:hypothetical protein DFH09DRAFT_1095710 [Mycena vulgaris]|nr:hypothetical protein DFH09DRAFT_1095710 [Mycena vulgaris]